MGLDKARQLASARGVDVEWVLADLCDYEPGERAYDRVVVLYLHLPARPVGGCWTEAPRPW